MSLTAYEQPLIICESGGKDSSVLVDLALKAKIPALIQHHHTTADAPETVRFIREKFKKLEAEGYKAEITFPYYKGKRTSMWDLIPQKQIPPTRLVRYCCAVLKEYGGNNQMIATGVRWDESTKRQSRGIYETIANKKENRIILYNDNDERRQLFENCAIKAKRVVNAIIDWSDNEIWDYISCEKLIVNPLYGCGWKRVGCIGCPMAGRKGRLFEFSEYPAYERLYRNAFERMLIARKNSGKDNSEGTWKTADDVFRWWMEDKNAEGQLSLIG